jgi:hypothetical protein
MVLLQRSRRTVLLVQSRNTIRAAFARGGAFPRLRTVGPRTVQRFGPSILLDDGRLLVEYGRGCAAGRGANSEIAVLAARSPSQLVRRMHGCGTTAPLAIDDGGAVVTLSLAGSTEAGGTLTASVSCPFVAALAAQRARRRSTCR